MNTASASLAADAPVLPPPPVAFAPAPEITRSTAQPIAILGVPIDHLTTADAVNRIDAMIASRRAHYVVTANVDFLVQAHQDVELRRILLEADLVTCDGTPLLWASRWLGNALPERVAGSDLTPKLMERAAERGHRVFLLGAAQGVGAQATANLKAALPNLNIVGHYSPPFSDLLGMDHDEIARRIRDARPDLLLVSFGSPKQEKWISMHYRTLGVPVSIGVGATLDFLAGRVKRAPEWMRHSGTEWLYRLSLEPRRLFKRYAKDLVYFLPTLALQCLHLRPRPHAPGRPRQISPAAVASAAVDAGERLTRRALEHDADFWQRTQQHAAHTILDVSGVDRIDSTGVAFLVRWRRALAARGCQLVLLAPSPVVRRALRSLHLADYFLIATDAANAAQQLDAAHALPTVQRDGTTRSLAWCGEIIAANVEDVWRMTAEHVQAFVASGATLIIVDLSRLRFIDSSGASLMTRLKQWAHTQHAELIFAHPQPNVVNVLRLTRLDQLLLEGAQ